MPPRNGLRAGRTNHAANTRCRAGHVPRVEQHRDEAGYMLLAVIFMVALVVLSLALAAPRVAAAIQRDREIEMVHRGEQYRRAIRLYYKKFGSYPTSIDQLEKTNNVRYLRKRYLDPLTGKDDWKLIRQGQAHVCPLGFFGQPLGINVGVPGATPVGATGSSLMGSSTGSGSFGASGGSSFGSSSGGASGSAFGGSSSSSGSSSTGMMDSSTSQIGTGGTNCGVPSGVGGASAVGSGGAIASGDGSGSGTGLGAGSSAVPATSSGSSGSSSSSTSTSTTLGGGNTNSTGFGADTSTTLGGAPIMGVEPPQTKATILQYKLKTHYNEWEFTYWPAEEQMAGGSILGGAGNINSSGNSVNGPGSSGTGGIGSTGINSGNNSGSGNGFGSGSSGTGSGNSSGSGSTGSQGTTTPQ